MIILFTTDMHGGLSIARYRKCLEDFIRTHNPDMLLDGGDSTERWNIQSGAARELGVLRDLGYAAMAVGNREFHFRPEAMKRKVGNIHPVLLAANLKKVSSHTGTASDADAQVSDFWPVQPSMIAECGDWRVGLVGLMSDMRRPQTRLDQFLSRVFRKQLVDEYTPSLAAVRNQVDHLRNESDVLLLLSHAGIQNDLALADEDCGIDMILSGESHSQHPLPNGDQRTAVFHIFSDEKGRCYDYRNGDMYRPWSRKFVRRRFWEPKTGPNVVVILIRLSWSTVKLRFVASAHNIITGDMLRQSEGTLRSDPSPQMDAGLQSVLKS
jgi:2',3'-cyclic-nucleotide 2'-phosphodiesterase (5'-nucleotidase family)